MLPNTIGRITGAIDKGSDTVVVTIQDLHCHPEAQRNIAGILSFLRNEYKAETVYLEGTWGKTVDTGWLRSITDESMRRFIIEGLINNGELTGVEKFAVEAPGVEVRGLEDEKLYKENSLRLKSITEERENVDPMVGEIEKAVTAVRKSYFNARQNKLESLMARHQAGKLKSEKYYAMLLKFGHGVGLEEDSYPNLRGYLNLLSLEKKTHYNKVSRELVKCVGELRKTLPYADYQALAQNTDNFQHIDRFYMQLEILKKNHPVSLRKYPALVQFFRYLETGRQVNPLALIKEERRLVNELGFAMAENRSQQEVVFLCAFTRVLKDFYTNKITAADYSYLTANYPEFEILYQVYAGKDTISRLAPFYTLYHHYYQANVQRNECFAANILEGNTRGTLEPLPGKEEDRVCGALRRAKRIVVAVTGGFHTEGLTGLLAEKGISSLTITPNVTEDTKKSDMVYARILAHQNRVLSQAFAAIALSLRGALPEMAGMAFCKYFQDLEAGRVPTEQVNEELNKLFENPLEYFSRLDPAFVDELKLTEGEIAASEVTALELHKGKDTYGNYLFSITMKGKVKEYSCTSKGIVTELTGTESREPEKSNITGISSALNYLMLLLSVIIPGKNETTPGIHVDRETGVPIVIPEKKNSLPYTWSSEYRQEDKSGRNYRLRTMKRTGNDDLFVRDLRNFSELPFMNPKEANLKVDNNRITYKTRAYPSLHDELQSLLVNKQFEEALQLMDLAAAHIFQAMGKESAVAYYPGAFTKNAKVIRNGIRVEVYCDEPLAVYRTGSEADHPGSYSERIKNEKAFLEKMFREIVSSGDALTADELLALSMFFGDRNIIDETLQYNPSQFIKQTGICEASSLRFLLNEYLADPELYRKLDTEQIFVHLSNDAKSILKQLRRGKKRYPWEILKLNNEMLQILCGTRTLDTNQRRRLKKLASQSHPDENELAAFGIVAFGQQPDRAKRPYRVSASLVRLFERIDTGLVDREKAEKEINGILKDLTARMEAFQNKYPESFKALSLNEGSVRNNRITAVKLPAMGDDRKRRFVLVKNDGNESEYECKSNGYISLVQSSTTHDAAVKTTLSLVILLLVGILSTWTTGGAGKGGRSGPAGAAPALKWDRKPEEPDSDTVQKGFPQIYQTFNPAVIEFVAGVMRKASLTKEVVPGTSFEFGVMNVPYHKPVMNALDQLPDGNENIEAANLIEKVLRHVAGLYGNDYHAGYRSADAAIAAMRLVPLKDGRTVVRSGDPLCLELGITEARCEQLKQEIIDAMIARIESDPGSGRALHLKSLVGKSPRVKEEAEKEWKALQETAKKERDQKRDRALTRVRGPWIESGIFSKQGGVGEFGFRVHPKWRTKVLEVYDMLFEKLSERKNSKLIEEIIEFTPDDREDGLIVKTVDCQTIGQYFDRYSKDAEAIKGLTTGIVIHLKELEKYGLGYNAGRADILCAMGIIPIARGRTLYRVMCGDFPYLKDVSGLEKGQAVRETMENIFTALEDIGYDEAQVKELRNIPKKTGKREKTKKNGSLRSYISILPYGLLLMIAGNLLRSLNLTGMETSMALTVLGMMLVTRTIEGAVVPSSPLESTLLYKKASILAASSMDDKNIKILLEEARLGMCPIGITMGPLFDTAEEVNLYLGSRLVPVGSIRVGGNIFTVCTETKKDTQGNEAVILSLGSFIIDEEGGITLLDEQQGYEYDDLVLIQAAQEIALRLQETDSCLGEEILRITSSFNVDRLDPAVFTLNVPAGLEKATLDPQIADTLAIVYRPVNINIEKMRVSKPLMAGADAIITTSRRQQQDVRLAFKGFNIDCVKLYLRNEFLLSMDTHLLSLVPVMLHKKTAGGVAGVRPGITFFEEEGRSLEEIEETLRRAERFNADVQLPDIEWDTYAELARWMRKEKIRVRVFANIVAGNGQPLDPDAIRQLSKMGFHFRIDLSRAGSNIDNEGLLKIKEAAPGKTVKIIPSDDNAAMARVLCGKNGYLYGDRILWGDQIRASMDDVEVSIEIRPPVGRTTLENENEMEKMLEGYFAAHVNDITLPASILYGSLAGKGFSWTVIQKILTRLIGLRFAQVPQRAVRKSYAVGLNMPMPGMTPERRREYLESLRFGMLYKHDGMRVPGFHVLLRAYDLLWKQGHRREFEEEACLSDGNYFDQFYAICRKAGLEKAPEWQPFLSYAGNLKRDAALGGREAKILASRKLMECLRGVMLNLLKAEYPCQIPFEKDSDRALWYGLLLQSDSFIIDEPHLQGFTIQANDPLFCEASLTRMSALPGMLLITGRMDVARNILVNIIGTKDIYAKIRATKPVWQLLYVEYLHAYSEMTSENLIGTVKAQVEGKECRPIENAVRMIFEGYDGDSLDGKPGLMGMYYNAARILEQMDPENKEVYEKAAIDAREKIKEWFDNGCVTEIPKNKYEAYEYSPLMLVSLSHTHDMLGKANVEKVMAMVKQQATSYGIRLPDHENGGHAIVQGEIVPGLMGYYLEALRREGKLSPDELADMARNFAYHVLERGGMSATLNADYSSNDSPSPEAVAWALRGLERFPEKKDIITVIEEDIQNAVKNTREILSAA